MTAAGGDSLWCRDRVAFFHLAIAHFVSCVDLGLLDQLGSGDKAVVGNGSVGGEGWGGGITVVGDGSVGDGSVGEGWGSGVTVVGDGSVGDGSVGEGWCGSVTDGGSGHWGDVLDSLLDGDWV